MQRNILPVFVATGKIYSTVPALTRDFCICGLLRGFCDSLAVIGTRNHSKACRPAADRLEKQSVPKSKVKCCQLFPFDHFVLTKSSGFAIPSLSDRTHSNFPPLVPSRSFSSSVSPSLFLYVLMFPYSSLPSQKRFFPVSFLPHTLDTCHLLHSIVQHACTMYIP